MIVSGKVIDSKTGESLPGATVAQYQRVQCVATPCNDTLIGGTSTDASGKFTMGILAGNYVKFSYVGYRPQVPTLRAGVDNTILLDPDTQTLPEAVATANRTYGKYILAALVLAFVAYMLYQK
jgi:hypothetical protein